jgi:hypothetical protein
MNARGQISGGEVPAWWRTVAVAAAAVLLTAVPILITQLSHSGADAERSQQLDRRVTLLESQVDLLQTQVSINTGRLTRLEAQLDRQEPR